MKSLRNELVLSQSQGHCGWSVVSKGRHGQNGLREIARLWNTQSLAVSVWRLSKKSGREAIERC